MGQVRGGRARDLDHTGRMRQDGVKNNEHVRHDKDHEDRRQRQDGFLDPAHVQQDHPEKDRQSEPETPDQPVRRQ